MPRAGRPRPPAPGAARAAAPSAAPAGRPPGRRPVRDERSAGGLVVDAVRPDARAVLIGRTDSRGRLEWVLPKGHVEPGEAPAETAVREVAEETGLAARVVAPLGDVDYWFVSGGARIHKTVHHFLLEAVGGELSDADVEVTEVAWFPAAEVAARLRYASERALLERLPGLLAAPA